MTAHDWIEFAVALWWAWAPALAVTAHQSRVLRMCLWNRGGAL